MMHDNWTDDDSITILRSFIEGHKQGLKDSGKNISNVLKELNLDERRKLFVELVGHMTSYELGQALLECEKKWSSDFFDGLDEYNIQKKKWRSESW